MRLLYADAFYGGQDRPVNAGRCPDRSSPASGWNDPGDGGAVPGVGIPSGYFVPSSASTASWYDRSAHWSRLKSVFTDPVPLGPKNFAV